MDKCFCEIVGLAWKIPMAESVNLDIYSIDIQKLTSKAGRDYHRGRDNLFGSWERPLDQKPQEPHSEQPWGGKLQTRRKRGKLEVTQRGESVYEKYI